MNIDPNRTTQRTGFLEREDNAVRALCVSLTSVRWNQATGAGSRGVDKRGGGRGAVTNDATPGTPPSAANQFRVEERV